MAFEISQIKTFVASEFAGATAEVHNFVAWLENRDNETKAALAQVNAAIPALTRAGYQVAVTPPAAS